MRRDQFSEAQPTSGRPATPDRRAFLGIGLGCAVPLAAGFGSLTAGDVLRGLQDPTVTDPVFDQLAAEAWRTVHEIQRGYGVRGEHARRLAGHLDLFAAHLKARKHDEGIDEEVRRLVHERGREAMAQDISARYREHVAGWPPSEGPERSFDAAGAGLAVDSVVSRGSVATLRAHRGALEALAARLDRTRTVATVAAIPAGVGQKPGDDFLGYPAVPVGDSCGALKVLSAVFTLLAGLVGFSPLAETLPVMAAFAAVIDTMVMILCAS